MTDTCSTCFYFRADAPLGTSKATNMGRCCAKLPEAAEIPGQHPVSGEIGVKTPGYWPRVLATDWCAQGRAKDSHRTFAESGG